MSIGLSLILDFSFESDAGLNLRSLPPAEAYPPVPVPDGPEGYLHGIDNHCQRSGTSVMPASYKRRARKGSLFSGLEALLRVVPVSGPGSSPPVIYWRMPCLDRRQGDVDVSGQPLYHALGIICAYGAIFSGNRTDLLCPMHCPPREFIPERHFSGGRSP